MWRWLTPLALLLSPLPALANNPPGPAPAIGLVALLVLLPVLTGLAGGYAVLRAAGKAPSRWRILAALLAVVFAGAHEGAAALVTIAVGILAFVRGVQLVRFGLRARRPPGGPGPAAVAPAARLLGFGAALVAATVLLVGNGVAFLGWYPAEHRILPELRRLVAYQLVEGRRRAGPDGVPRFEPSKSAREPVFERAVFSTSHAFRTTVTVSPDGGRFVAEVVPARMPLFPYNLLVTLPSFRADETGAIRGIRVHDAGERCPADAPVVHQVDEQDLAEMKAELDRRVPLEALEPAPAAPAATGP